MYICTLYTRCMRSMYILLFRVTKKKNEKKMTLRDSHCVNIYITLWCDFVNEGHDFTLLSIHIDKRWVTHTHIYSDTCQT